MVEGNAEGTKQNKDTKHQSKGKRKTVQGVGLTKRQGRGTDLWAGPDTGQGRGVVLVAGLQAEHGSSRERAEQRVKSGGWLKLEQGQHWRQSLSSQRGEDQQQRWWKLPGSLAGASSIKGDWPPPEAQSQVLESA